MPTKRLISKLVYNTRLSCMSNFPTASWW